MGALLDKSFAKNHNPKGKFRPWLLRSAPLVCVSFTAFWSVPSFFEGVSLIFVLFGLKILYEGCYTIFNIPMGSMLSAMANDDRERASLSSARGFGSAVGNMIPVMLMPMLIKAFGQTNPAGYAIGASICAVIGLGMCLAHYALTEERNIAETSERNRRNQTIIKYPPTLFYNHKCKNSICLSRRMLFFYLRFVTVGILIFI